MWFGMMNSFWPYVRKASGGKLVVKINYFEGGHAENPLKGTKYKPKYQCNPLDLEQAVYHPPGQKGHSFAMANLCRVAFAMNTMQSDHQSCGHLLSVG
ncbi:hypothetical protein BCT05_17120 [Vibrio breoganii]|nr:hypothetical protein BCT05_17120 [Vibrio breoganii]